MLDFDYKESMILLNVGNNVANDFELQQYRCEHLKSSMCTSVTVFT